MSYLANLLDKIRERGWPRRIAVLVVLILVLLIPYPLSITGDFEVISLRPVMVRNKVEGTLDQILVKMGDTVKEGQVVARLLDVELKLERANVHAQLTEVEAQLRLAQKGFRTEEIQMARFRVDGLQADVTLKAANLRREKALYRAKDIPKARLDEATSEHVQAQKALGEARQELKKLSGGLRDEEIAQAAAKVEQLKGRLAATEQHLEWTELKAPKAGRVVTPDHELQKRLGTLLPRGAPVIDIVDPSDLVARVVIPESEFGDVELGLDVDLRAFQYPGKSFTGVVDAIEPQVEQETEFSSVVPVLTRVKDSRWSLLRVHTKGRAKIALGYSTLGYVLYRRVLRSTFVKLWSWY
ncbi:MAG: efflux RND transporter periplasmic adaptor subunit [Deltaproteobacteria bacterium]|nr:efflux RND transporter periplasmic adaptor subunit [Deltaproteobacteria bacterium]